MSLTRAARRFAALAALGARTGGWSSSPHASGACGAGTTQGRYLQRILQQLCPNTYRQLSTSGPANPFSISAGTSGGGAFQPSRLYRRPQRATPEAYAFWGLIAANVAVMVFAKQEVPEVRQFVLTHLRTSVEALADGRYHTLATSMFSHLSAVHCAINLGMLAAFRRTQQLSAGELLRLYALGGLLGAASHVAYHYYDAGGLEYGTTYALNTPAFFGCSGAVAAITGYKLFMEPAALQLLLVVPMPLLFAALLYVSIAVKEPEYFDGPPAKYAGLVVGLLAGAAAAALRRRSPAWLRSSAQRRQQQQQQAGPRGPPL